MKIARAQRQLAITTSLCLPNVTILYKRLYYRDIDEMDCMIRTQVP